MLVLRNPLRFSALAGIGGIFVLLGYLFVVAGQGVLYYFNLNDWKILVNGELTSIWGILIIAVLIGFLIAKLFMTVFSMAIDTILVCFITDEEIQNAKGGGTAKHTPEPLRDFLAK
jgi:hypothetical protein